MNSLKRIFVSIKTQIDHVADEFENHEALATVAIQDLQALLQKTRLHLHRVSKLSADYQEKINQEREQTRLWSERAIKVHAEDEAKALQCVRRLRDSQRQIVLLEQQFTQSNAEGNRIRNDLDAIQEQIQILKNKKEVLAARQNRNTCQEVLQEKHGCSLHAAQTVFERWEEVVVSSEAEAYRVDESDNLAQAFEQEEDKLSLKMMLDELTSQHSNIENQ